MGLVSLMLWERFVIENNQIECRKWFKSLRFFFMNSTSRNFWMKPPLLFWRNSMKRKYFEKKNFFLMNINYQQKK